MDDATLRSLQTNYLKMTGGLQVPEQKAAPTAAAPAAGEKKRSGWMNFIPMATSIIGGIGGSFLAPGAGTAAGGAAGGALGEWLTQKLSGEKSNLAKIGVEGAFGALGGVGKAAKAAKGAATAIRAGEGLAEGANILRKGVQVGETAADLSKAAKAVKFAEQGTTVASDAKSAAGGIKGWIGSKLTGAADDTALRASQLSGKKEALKGFDKRFGEDLGTYLRKNDLIGKTGKDVESTVIKKLSGEYGDEVAKIGRSISPSDVLTHNQKELQKLLDSGSSAGKKLGDDVFEELSQIFKKEGDNLTPKRLNEIKAEYQANARNAYKLGSNAKPGVDEKVASFLKKTLQGVSGSDKLATTGKELDKAYKAADLLSSAAQNGRGTLSLGLTDLMAAGGGGAIGSLPGAAVAVAGKRAINSPKVQSFIAEKLASAGEKMLAGGAEKAAETGVKSTVKGMLKAQAVPRLLQAGANSAPTAPTPQDPNAPQSSQLNPNSPFNPSSPNYNPSLIDPNAAGTGIAGVMGASESPYSLENMRADAMRDPANADQYSKLYEIMNPKGAEDTLSLSDAAITKTTDAQKALSGLDELDTILANGYAGGKISGNLRKFNPLDNTFKTQQASIDRIRQIVGKALEGGVLRKEDEDKYKKILPTMQDEPEVYKSKVAQLRQMLGADMQQYLALQQQYGKGAGQVAAGGSDIASLMSM